MAKKKCEKNQRRKLRRSLLTHFLLVHQSGFGVGKLLFGEDALGVKIR